MLLVKPEASMLFQQSSVKAWLLQAGENDDMQGAQIPRNKSYMEYFAVTRGEASRRWRDLSSRFSTTCCGNQEDRLFHEKERR